MTPKEAGAATALGITLGLGALATCWLLQIFAVVVLPIVTPLVTVHFGRLLQRIATARCWPLLLLCACSAAVSFSLPLVVLLAMSGGGSITRADILTSALVALPSTLVVSWFLLLYGANLESSSHDPGLKRRA